MKRQFPKSTNNNNRKTFTIGSKRRNSTMLYVNYISKVRKNEMQIKKTMKYHLGQIFEKLTTRV